MLQNRVRGKILLESHSAQLGADTTRETYEGSMEVSPFSSSLQGINSLRSMKDGISRTVQTEL